MCIENKTRAPAATVAGVLKDAGAKTLCLKHATQNQLKKMLHIIISAWVLLCLQSGDSCGGLIVFTNDLLIYFTFRSLVLALGKLNKLILNDCI